MQALMSCTSVWFQNKYTPPQCLALRSATSLLHCLNFVSYSFITQTGHPFPPSPVQTLQHSVGNTACCSCRCWMRPSKPHGSCDPSGCHRCDLLWILVAQQVGKSPSPALSLLLQSLSNDVFSCLLVTYRDIGQSSLLWRLPGGALLPAPHARKAVAALPKASPPSTPGDKREPHAHIVSSGKGKELVWICFSFSGILQGLTVAAPHGSW